MLKNNENLVDGFEVINAKTTSFSNKWKPVLGEEKEILDEHNQLVVELLQKSRGRKMNLVFRLFNEGLAFRYEIPTQEKLNYFVKNKKLMHFTLRLASPILRCPNK